MRYLQSGYPISGEVSCVDEEDGVEAEKGKMVRYCVECAFKKGYAHYKEEKGEKILTFFTESDINQV